MANPESSNDREKEWKSLKLTPIKEEEDGTNNYSEFRQKSFLDLDAIGLWPYVSGPDYNPPIIPDLMQTMQVQGLDSTGAPATFTMPGNEAAVDAAKKDAAAWLAADKKALSLIVKAIPSAKLYLVRDCTSAHAAWNALKNEYEPANALTAITIKQQIIGYQCDEHDNPVNWRQVMIQLYGKLRDADPYMMPDTEFAKHLITLMTPSDAWRYCRDSLREKVRQGEAMGNPVSSAWVINRLKQEEVEKKIAPSIVSINALVTGGRSRYREPDDAVAGVYTAGPTNQANRKNTKQHQRQERRSGPYNPQQRPPAGSSRGGRAYCENTHCETPLGHTKADCFSYGGGKAGQYPEGFRGRKDIHLSHEARTAARRKHALGASGSRFAGMVEHTNDGEEQVNAVFEKVEDAFAFMLQLPDVDSDDEIGIDEEIHVNAVALNLEVAQDDTVNHDTGASRHIFHRRELFHDYVQFDTPLNVHGFGANLSAQAVGKGKIVMKATYDGVLRQFSVSNALHIPTARCNLISGSQCR
ncbi:hypothetical protein DFH06DRAFT_1251254 [Mycena polygramma]|nr:hypothetical protein DFH06DRAFT_1251254 [Mycena polygramma]